MTSISRNMYIDELHDIVNEKKNAHYINIKMKFADVKSNTYLCFLLQNSNKDPNFKAGDHVIMTKYKKCFAKGYTSNCSEDVLEIKKVKNTVPWTYVIEELSGEKIVGTFCKKDSKGKPNRVQN